MSVFRRVLKGARKTEPGRVAIQAVTGCHAFARASYRIGWGGRAEKIVSLPRQTKRTGYHVQSNRHRPQDTGKGDRRGQRRADHPQGRGCGSGKDFQDHGKIKENIRVCGIELERF